jgi:hypothetical protein
MKIEFHKNQRGFRTGTFTDRYGEKCSIQKSSLATEDAIWLGIDDAKPRILCSDAVRLGIAEIGNPVGWMPFAVPEEVLFSTRMHLTQEQVKELLPILQKFVETGEI